MNPVHSSPAFPALFLQSKIQNLKSKFPLLVFILALSGNQAWAQLVIPASRFPTALGDSFVSFTNRDTIHVIYDPNASSWDFSTGPQTDSSVTVLISASRTPHPDSFPLAQVFERAFLLRDTMSTYLYGNKPLDSLYIYGVSADTGNGQYSVLRMLPDMKICPFPLQAGVSWTSIDSIPLGTYLGFRVVAFDTSYGRVLKEGTVTGPFGGPSPCLLVRSSRRSLAKVRIINLVVDTLYQETAEWLVPDWGTVVTITSTAKDSSWPITRVGSGGFTRLWQFMSVGVEVSPPPASRRMPYELGPAFPNPMREQTVIPFSCPLPLTPYPLSLSIYDPTGRVIRVLTSHESRVTNHSFVWDGRDSDGKPVGSGVYFYRLEAGPFTATRKLVVVR